MARFSLIPHEEKFFSDFVALSEQIRIGARTLRLMFAVDPPDMEKADVIKEIEHVCDGQTHSIIERLNRTFVTPLDREDIHSLAISMDDVMDAMEAAVDLVVLYQIGELPPEAINRFAAGIVVGQFRSVAELVEKPFRSCGPDSVHRIVAARVSLIAPRFNQRRLERRVRRGRASPLRGRRRS